MIPAKYQWPDHWNLSDRMIYQRWENEETLSPWEERWIAEEVLGRNQKPKLRALTIVERERAQREKG